MNFSTPKNLIGRISNFFHSPIAGGALLIACALAAITLSHIPYTVDWFESLWNTPFTIGFEGFAITHTVKEWINDAFMAVFFFVVGLEIKREIVAGQLSTIRQASLPIAAAIGGMVVPALIYVMFNGGTISEQGWGIPMATDIAFALGILSMFSKKVPFSLKIFLTALAVVDDLGAILVIALFYSSQINFLMLGVAALVMAFLITLNVTNVYKMRWYLIPSIVLWLLFLNSGIHATIAGVLIAMTMPATAKYSKSHFVGRARELTSRFKNTNIRRKPVMCNDNQHHALEELRGLARNSISPVQRLEYSLHGAVNFFIMPLFALANAGVIVSAADLSQLVGPQGLGIELGLVIGKPLGIMLFSFIIIRSGLSSMPSGATWRTMFGVACLGGIGFTMSIFIDMLAFESGSPLINYGKMAILSASLIAAVLGSVVLMTGKRIDSKDSW